MLGTMRCGYLVPVLAMWLLSCGGSDDDPQLGGLGESCTKAADCELGLKCLNLVCEQAGGNCPLDRDCSSLECGRDPVCGESCGTCGDGETCQAGACVSGECVANCSGLECGPDPECGDSCGTCEDGKNCDGGTCVAGECAPDCSGLECGPDRLCGQSCGTCTQGLTCSFGLCGTLAAGESWFDSDSDLTWQVVPTGGLMNFEQAKRHCETLRLAGNSDWSLPTIGKLRTLIRGCNTAYDGCCLVGKEESCFDASCHDDCCNGCTGASGPGKYGQYWPDEMNGDIRAYWSSSPMGMQDDFAWSVAFWDGSIGTSPVAQGNNVRCVR